MNQAQKKEAKRLFKTLKVDKLFINKKGEFFTKRDLAINSVKESKDVKELKKPDYITVENNKENNSIETVTKSEGGMVIITDDKKELTFSKIKDEVREPIEGDEATIDGKPATGDYKYQGSSLTFKEGKLIKIVFNKEASRSLFTKIFGK